jgi:UTP--glucose-1-phosphate uridylyltransferase
MKVVVPAAGLGMRLRPLTGGSLSKEMLPLGGRPLIWHALREAASAGFESAIVVVSPGKEKLVSYLFSGDLPVPIALVTQPSPAGVGDAVLLAASVAGVPFGVLTPDDVTHSRVHWPRLQRAHAVLGGAAAICLRRVQPSTAHRFGIAACHAEGEFLRISGLVEKPLAGTAPSNLAIFGRYIVTRPVLDALEVLRGSVSGELELTDGLAAVVSSSPGVVGVPFRGRFYDNGTAAAYTSSVAEYAVRQVRS